MKNCRQLTVGEAFANTAVFNPEFVVASVYAIVSGIKETVRPSKSPVSIGYGCVIILLVGSFVKTRLSWKETEKGYYGPSEEGSWESKTDTGSEEDNLGDCSYQGVRDEEV